MKIIWNKRMKTIQYGIDTTTGLVWSRVGSEVAVPVFILCIWKITFLGIYTSSTCSISLTIITASVFQTGM